MSVAGFGDRFLVGLPDAVDDGRMARIARGAVVELTAEIDDLHDGSPAMRNDDLRSDRFDVGFGGKCQTLATGKFALLTSAPMASRTNCPARPKEAARPAQAGRIA